MFQCSEEAAKISMRVQFAPVLVAIFCINKLNSVTNEKYASQQDKQMHWWHLQNTVGAD